MNSKVAIVGKARNTRHLAPFHKPEFDIWGINDVGMEMPESDGRWDAWFQIHPMEDILRDMPAHVEWLAAQDAPVYMRADHTDTIPACIQYPLTEVLADFDDRRYLTSTAAIAVALAIYRGYKKIHLYGIEMANTASDPANGIRGRIAAPDKYGEQRSCLEFYLGIAIGRGIKVYLPEGCPLLRCAKLYGLEGGPNGQ